MFKPGDRVVRKPNEYSPWWREMCKEVGIRYDSVVTIGDCNRTHCNIEEFPYSKNWHTNVLYFTLVEEQGEVNLGDWL